MTLRSDQVIERASLEFRTAQGSLTWGQALLASLERTAPEHARKIRGTDRDPHLHEGNYGAFYTHLRGLDRHASGA